MNLLASSRPVLVVSSQYYTSQMQRYITNKYVYYNLRLCCQYTSCIVTIEHYQMYVVICLFVSLELSSAANMNSHDDPTNFLVRGLALALVEFISKMFLYCFMVNPGIACFLLVIQFGSCLYMWGRQIISLTGDNQGIIEDTGTETSQIFFRMFVMIK